MKNAPAAVAALRPVWMLMATFAGLPAAARLTPSDCRVLPFHDDLDFETFEILGRSRRQRPPVRTLLNYTQKYRLLADVLAAVRECSAGTGSEIVLSSRMPSTVRMPAAMLGDGIFVVLDVDAEAARLADRGCSVIALYEGLIRYAIEEGENELVLRWTHGPADAGTRLQRLRSRLQALGFEVAEPGIEPRADDGGADADGPA